MLPLRIGYPSFVSWHEVDQTTGCLERLAYRGEGGKGQLHAARVERVHGNDQVRFWSAFHHTLRLIIELALDCVVLGEDHERARKRWITVAELLAYLIGERWAIDLFGNAVQFVRRCDHSLCLAAPGLHSEP